MENLFTEPDTQVAALQNGVSVRNDISSYQHIEAFTKIINEAPPATSIQKTPDGNADTMGISFVETKLDEVYLRQWGTEDVEIMQLANELLCWLTLWVIDPQTKVKITRAGFACVQIMVDKAPQGLQGPERNAWALNMQNKKPNALKMMFPALKSLATKNAAVTLGKAFGRDLNRKHEDTPGNFYENILNNEATLTDASKDIQAASTKDELLAVWNAHPELHANEAFLKDYNWQNVQINRKNRP